jgi:hypothetical protein
MRRKAREKKRLAQRARSIPPYELQNPELPGAAS